MLRGDANASGNRADAGRSVIAVVAETQRPPDCASLSRRCGRDTAREEARAVNRSASASEPAPAVAAPPVAPRRVASRAVVATPRATARRGRACPVEAPEPPVERRAGARRSKSDPGVRDDGARRHAQVEGAGRTALMGDGKITIIPTNNPASPLCSFPYGRVIAINVSRGRDPLWNSPQGPAPVARAGGTLSKFGIQVSRDWIALRTSTEEQFVSMRFDEVLLKRVLLALEERTGHQSALH